MIDYGEVLNKSYKVFIKFKFLWLFGFLGALSSGGGNFNSFGRFPSGDSGDKFGGNAGKFFSKMPSIGIAIIIAIVVFILLLVLILLILRVISTGALIGSVNNIEKQEEASVKKGFIQGLHYFFSLLGIFLVIYIPVFLIMTILLAILIGPGITALILKKYVAGAILLIIGGLIAIVLLIVIAIFSNIVKIVSYRYRIIDKSDVMTSIKSAISLVREKIGTLFVTWLITVAIGIVAGIVIAIPVIILFVPAMALLFVNVFAAILVAIPAMIVSSFLSGLLETYISTFWTLAFIDITAPQGEVSSQQTTV